MCLVGEMSVGEVSVGEESIGEILSGMCPGIFKNTRTKSCRCSAVVIVNFEHILHLFLVFLLLTLNK